MTPERYRQIGELYHAALEVEGDERVTFLDRACAGDAELRREVESLISSHEQAGDFIAAPALTVAAELLAARETGALAGQTIARYRVLSLLGAGGMGRVYLAEDTDLRRRVALKLLPEYFTHDSKQVQRFRQEARAVSALNHPNIVTIHEIGQTDSGHFIATEFIDGETLRDHMTRTRMTIAEVLDVAVQVASALQAAHDAGIVHRDIKPENIMLRRDGITKVLDFGLAKLALPGAAVAEDAPTESMVKTEPGLVMGTARYMSPEQARGFDVDARTDIFSLGVVLYEMLTGRRPFAGETTSDVVAAILTAEPAPLVRYAPDAPAELQRIVRKALAKDPDERYQSVKEMTTDLRALIRDEPPRRGVRRALFGAVVLAVIAIAIGIMLILTRRPVATAGIQVSRLTTRGDVTEAAISPDGKYIAYVAWMEKGQTLVLRQLATGQELELVTPPGPSSIDAGFWGHTFTPDGSAILYSHKGPMEPQGALYRISTIGGRPEHLLDGIDSQVTFSPDGKRISFLRADFPAPAESALMVARSDGSGAKSIAVRRLPERLAPLFYVAPSWSPDGHLIATAMVRTAHPATARVIGVDPDTGSESVLAVEPSWAFVGQVEWLLHGRGLIVIAAEFNQRFPSAQIWLVPKSGRSRRLTNDFLQYRSTSLTADGKSLLAVVFERTANIWRMPLEKMDQAERTTSGNADGFMGLSYLPDGRVVFSSIEGARPQLSIANLDTGVRTQITRGANANAFPAAFRGGIAYVSTTPHDSEICVTSAEGEGRRVIVRDVEQAAIAVSPDGRWVAYGANGRLWRIPIGGGAAVQLFDAPASGPSWSPAGDRIAFYYGRPNQPRIGVLPASGGPVSWSVPAAVYAYPTVRWLADGSGLLITAQGKDLSNIWKQWFRGDAQRLTNFYEQYANTFDLSPDGKWIALSRGQISRDAVMITNFE